VTGARRSIVVVHGLWMNGAAMQFLAHGLEPHGFDVRVFHYPSITQSLAANAARLARFYTEVPGDEVSFVGHSLGGVLIREMLDLATPTRPGRVVTLGSPLTGSCTGLRVNRLPGGARLLGLSIGDHIARGSNGPWRAPLPLGSIAGNLPYGVGRLFGALKGPNDGTVAVAETELEGAADHIVLPVTHFALLWSRAVLAQTLEFLEHGRFVHPR
jgi:pimeloyl-ACP methyl ester carboxylesterase